MKMLDIINHWQEYQALNNKISDKNVGRIVTLKSVQ